MAGFHSNSCSYIDCGRKFDNLHDLIYHIEDEHVDFQEAPVAENTKSAYVPMSYILKFSTLYPREKPPKRESDCTKCEEQISIDSDDSWNESCSSIAMNSTKEPHDPNYHCKKDSCRLKRFVCPVPGCNKRYKNINGIKYHTKKGHDDKKSTIMTKKLHKCQCGKSYKTVQSLKAHTSTHKEHVQPFHHTLFATSHVPTPKLPYAYNKPYIRHEMMSGHSSGVIKNEVFDENVLNCSYLEQVPKLSDTIEVESSGSFGLLPSSHVTSTFSFNEHFLENFIIEDHNS